MRMSKTFVKTLREAPKEETATNGALLTRAGFIHKEMAGVYDYLPFGMRVINNIENIVRDELNKIGCEEMQFTALQNPELWEKTGRWSDQEVDIWFKTEVSSGGMVGLAPTHEEPITNMMKNYISSYKDLPLAVYQFQTKFRNEKRAKSGIMRGREFLMKDLYSFHTSQEDLDNFYDKVFQAYINVYKRVGLGDVTFPCFASGGIFSKFSHEFQTILPVGEDTIYYTKDKSIVLNKEVVIPEVLKEFNITKDDLIEDTAAEVGNIFKLGTKFSAPLDLEYTDGNNERREIYMGCYGIGISRLMGVLAEYFSDDKGLYWPESVTPYKYYLVGIDEAGIKEAEKLYKGHDELIIFDDRDLRPGEKFADADLIGIPYRVVVSDKTLAKDSVEITDRKTGKSKLVSIKDFKKSCK